MSKQRKEAGYGDAWAAKKNQEFEVRSRIVQALQELGIEPQKWPLYVQRWHAGASKQPKFSSSAIPPSFQPPTCERLRDSIADWKKQADLAWKQHRDRFIRQIAIDEELGIDEKVPPLRKSRGPGRSAHYSHVQERWKWAALRLLGHPGNRLHWTSRKRALFAKPRLSS